MNPIIVTNQAEYDAAQKTYQDAFNKSYFDIDRGKGMEIVEEVDYLMYNYIYKGESREKTEESLAHFYFTKPQAQEVAGYFITHRPGDMYDIERGLNSLNVYTDKEINTNASLIYIKNSSEPIQVRFPVEVFGNSVVEALGYCKVIAHDNAVITARNHTIVEGHDTVQVEAFGNSHITARNNCSVILHDTATVAGYNYVKINAKDYSSATVFNQVHAEIQDNVLLNAHDHALIQGKNNSGITAYDDVTVNAYDNSRVIARNMSYIVAQDSAKINAYDHSAVVAYNAVTVSAANQALVFTRDDAVCETKDKARVITDSQNKPDFLKDNVLQLLDHPFINKKPVIAVNLLLASSNPKYRDDFSTKLKEMGCIDPASTDKVLNAFVKEHNRELARTRGKDPSREW
jgi:hypothetical protein